ncbi:MAG: hypothetical protein H6861_03790 [Rhodospirillales bacterium]|nr:hypothetical protein [Rhodospirillales bacterium]
MRTVVLSSMLALALTGCKPLWDPTYMPSGYAHHQKMYKAPPGPEASAIGYGYSAKQNAAVQESWRKAVSDLVLRAEAHDMLGAPVFLTTDINPGPFASAYDFALREELRAAGVTLAANAEEGTELFYSAYDPAEKPQAESLTGFNDEAAHPNKDGDFLPPSKPMELVLAVVEDDIIGKKVSTMQDLPLYGFKPAGYAHLHERPREVDPKQCSGHEAPPADTDKNYND